MGDAGDIAHIQGADLVNGVPIFGIANILQLGGDQCKRCCHFFKTGADLAKRANLFHSLQVVACLGSNVFHQVLTPHSLGGIVNTVYIRILDAPLQPAVRVHMTLGAVVNLKDQIGHGGIVSTDALGVYK